MNKNFFLDLFLTTDILDMPTTTPKTILGLHLKPKAKAAASKVTKASAARPTTGARRKPSTRLSVRPRAGTASTVKPKAKASPSVKPKAKTVPTVKPKAKTATTAVKPKAKTSTTTAVKPKAKVSLPTVKPKAKVATPSVKPKAKTVVTKPKAKITKSTASRPKAGAPARRKHVSRPATRTRTKSRAVKAKSTTDVVYAGDLAGAFMQSSAQKLPPVQSPQTSQAWNEYNRIVRENPGLAAAIYGVDPTTRKIRCPSNTYRDPKTKECMPLLESINPAAVAEAINSLSGNINFGESCAAGQAVDWKNGVCVGYQWPTDENNVRVPLPGDNEGRAQMIAYLAARRPDDKDFLDKDGDKVGKKEEYFKTEGNETLDDIYNLAKGKKWNAVSDDDRKKLAARFRGSWDPVHGKFTLECNNKNLLYQPAASKVCKPSQPQSAKYRLEYLQALYGINPLPPKGGDDDIPMFAPQQQSKVWGDKIMRRFKAANPVNFGFQDGQEVGQGKSAIF